MLELKGYFDLTGMIERESSRCAFRVERLELPFPARTENLESQNESKLFF
jgi:hypothetical protein